MSNPMTDLEYPTRAEIDACIQQAQTMRSAYARDLVIRASRSLASFGQSLTMSRDGHRQPQR